MALIWRLVPPAFATELNGKGNINSGARWNSPGHGVVYASFNLSLCVLEAFVQFPIPLRVNLPEMAAVRIEIPDVAPVHHVELAELPPDLEDIEIETARRCREIGDAWLAAEEHLVLTARSFVVPQERNVMINPAHGLMGQVNVVSIERFRFDARLATRST